MYNNYADKGTTPELLKNLASAAATAATLTKAADASEFWVVDWITWSYSAAPTGGKLTVALGGVSYLEVDITAGGPGQLQFDHPLYTGTKNEALLITLASGGGAVVGKVSARIR